MGTLKRRSHESEVKREALDTLLDVFSERGERFFGGENGRQMAPSHENEGEGSPDHLALPGTTGDQGDEGCTRGVDAIGHHPACPETARTNPGYRAHPGSGDANSHRGEAAGAADQILDGVSQGECPASPGALACGGRVYKL